MTNFKKIISFILFIALTGVYLTCGYIVGYHRGYKTGQADYIEYINKAIEK